MSLEFAVTPDAGWNEERRRVMVTKKPHPTIRAEVEGDEVSIVAGHKGTPDEVVKKGDADGAGGSRASGDEGRLPPRNL